jgi:chromosome segregation ATPase
MEFNQPTTLPIDKETQAHINALNVQIADKEAQIVRLGAIITSNQYTIQQLANEKAELEEKIPVLREEIAKKQDESKSLDGLINEKVKVLDELTEEYVEKTAALKEREEDVEEKEKQIAKEIEKVSDDRMKVITDRVEIASLKEEVEKKIAALKQIIN